MAGEGRGWRGGAGGGWRGLRKLTSPKTRADRRASSCGDCSAMPARVCSFGGDLSSIVYGCSTVY